MYTLDKMSLNLNSLSCKIGTNDKVARCEFNLKLDLYFDVQLQLQDRYCASKKIVVKLIKQFFLKDTFLSLDKAALKLVYNLLESCLIFKKVAVELENFVEGDAVHYLSISRHRQTVHIGLGSNIGDKLVNLKKAIRLLNQVGLVKQVSHFYKTKPVGSILQDDFVNAVVKLESFYCPSTILQICKSIEKSMGRVACQKWGPRLIDIDILTIDQIQMQSEKLIVPHPHMHKREFVLRPMIDVSPFAIHPVYNMNMVELYEFAKLNK